MDGRMTDLCMNHASGMTPSALMTEWQIAGESSIYRSISDDGYLCYCRLIGTLTNWAIICQSSRTLCFCLLMAYFHPSSWLVLRGFAANQKGRHFCSSCGEKSPAHNRMESFLSCLTSIASKTDKKWFSGVSVFFPCGQTEWMNGYSQAHCFEDVNSELSPSGKSWSGFSLPHCLLYPIMWIHYRQSCTPWRQFLPWSILCGEKFY